MITCPIYFTDAVPGVVTDLNIVSKTSRSLKIFWRKPSEWKYSAVIYEIICKPVVEGNTLNNTEENVIFFVQ